MKKKKSSIDLDYLRRCKKASPESRLEWLASVVEFAKTPKKIIKVGSR